MPESPHSEEFDALTQKVESIKLHMLSGMDVFDFIKWVRQSEDGGNPTEDGLAGCLPYCNEWQESIVLHLLANLYPKKDA